MQVIRTSNYDHDSCTRNTRYTVYLNGTEYNLLRRAINAIGLPDPSPDRELLRQSIQPCLNLDQVRLLSDLAIILNESV